MGNFLNSENIKMIKFIGSFDTVKSLPNSAINEFAFIGRSNVGKSSLLNALVGSKVARTSNTPGRTQLINLFEWLGVVLADLPGYGYAKVSKEAKIKWAERLEEYLCNRGNLKKLFILVDSRHGLKDSDLDLMNFCDVNGIIYQVILTKADKISKSESANRKLEVAGLVTNRPAHNGEVVLTSSEKKLGMAELKLAVVDE